MIDLYCGDSLDVLKGFGDNTFSALITDPPASISLVGKEWDSNKGGRDQWIAWLRSILEECLRVMKPGAHGLIWALPRTSHYTAMAAELAGFEIRDIVHHIFGSGYPTGKHISKEFDKREGKGFKGKVTSGRSTNSTMYRSFGSGEERGVYEDSLPESELAVTWFDWHSKLAPGAEHWIMVRKPIDGSIIDNVETFGTGVLNIGASRVPRTDGYQKAWDKPVSTNISSEGYILSTQGQHVVDLSENKPANGFTKNIVLSHHEECHSSAGYTIEESTQSGFCHPDCPIYQINSSGPQTKSKRSQRGKTSPHYVTHEKYNNPNAWIGESTERGFEDSGGRARYFNQFGYYTKVAPSDKRFYCSGCNQVFPGKKELREEHKDHGIVEHPTPKSTPLMEWLIRLITPPGGIVLDPFFGTGSTGVACRNLGFDCVGIDFTEDYLKIADSRLKE